MRPHKLTIEYDEYESPDELAEDEQSLLESAWTARQNSYAPYSNFNVGAAVLTKDGQVYQGSNQENANFKVSCAERVALDSIGAAGKKDSIVKLAVVGGPNSLDRQEIPNDPEEPITPCGQCRQDIKEAEDLSDDPVVIILASRNRIRRFVGVKQLLPFAFGPADLGISLK